MYDKVMKELERKASTHSGFSFGDPVVTFCCPTFGTAARKPELLNSVVYWYLRQTYPFRELLILNDAQDQKLWCSPELRESGVRILNWPMRIKTLGEKRNLLVTFALGAIILPQDDDDVSLPGRAEQAVRMLADAEYWTPGLWAFAPVGLPIVASSNGYGHNCSAYRRASLYNQYENRTGDEDARVHEWALRTLRVNSRHITAPQDITYVYRWGVSDRHISGYGVDNIQTAYDGFDPGPPGTYELKAETEVDWVEKVREELIDVKK